MVTKEQFAKILNGRQYAEEITEQEHEIAKENGLLVAFGYSDDNLELRGILYDEYGAYEGTCRYFKLDSNGKLEVIEHDHAEPEPSTIPYLKIEAQWIPPDLDSSWLITANVPHATFDIFEDDNLFCRGIVIQMSDIERAIKVETTTQESTDYAKLKGERDALIEALVLMVRQYLDCGDGTYSHVHMTAGETALDALEDLGLVKSKDGVSYRFVD